MTWILSWKAKQSNNMRQQISSLQWRKSKYIVWLQPLVPLQAPPRQSPTIKQRPCILLSKALEVISYCPKPGVPRMRVWLLPSKFHYLQTQIADEIKLLLNFSCKRKYFGLLLAYLGTFTWGTKLFATIIYLIVCVWLLPFEEMEGNKNTKDLIVPAHIILI